MGDAKAGNPPATSKVGEPWDAGRIEAFGGALIAAASAARIGISAAVVGSEHAQIVYVSDIGAEIVGHAKEVILSRSAISFLAPEEQRSLAPNLEERRRGTVSPTSMETVVVTADGRRVPLEVSIAQIQLDGMPLLINFFRDITERREAVEALARSEERFRTLIEWAPDAVWIIDGRRLLFVNRAAITMLGWDHAEQVLLLDPTDFVHPDDRQAMRERMAKMLESGEALAPHDYRVRRRDGSWVMTEVHSMPVEWEGVRAIIGIARDVTRRKATEAREAMEVQLESERKNRALEADLARIWRLNTVGELASGLAHEISQPIGSIFYYAQSLLRLVKDQPSADPILVDSVEEICKEAERAAKLVSSLRAFIGKREPNKAPEEINSIITEITSLVARELKTHHVSLHLHLTGSPAQVAVDRIQIGQVILNLLRNAIESMADTSGARELTIATTIEEAHVRVSVTDKGCGIPKENLARVFDPLVSTKSTGMGMGLAISSSIVGAHAGRLWAVSTLNEGSTFFLTLPSIPEVK